MLTKSRFVVDQTTHRVSFERRMTASPDWLFSAWVTPEMLRLCWDPSGEPLAICEVDLRVGGALRLVNAGNADHASAGVYRVIERPNRIQFDAMGAAGTVTFRAEGDETVMLVEILCPSAEHLAMMMKMGVAEGTAQTMDNLVAFAAAQVAR